MSLKPLLSLRLVEEQDVVRARQCARNIAALLGFQTQDQTRISTAVSEIARNAYEYARDGSISFAFDADNSALFVTVIDSGKGIPDLPSVLEGRYRSSTGMGVGLIGTRRLMDSFEIQSSDGGTKVVFSKRLPLSAPPPDWEHVSRELTRSFPRNLLDEVQRQNRELLGTLEELRVRQDQLDALNSELEDTNRGVVALYAELDERADELKRANETKTRFLSSMSHELRTPINAIMGLTQLLGSEVDGPLTQEQHKQVNFIRLSGQSLGELVNDLLDLAKVEAGKVVIRPETFEVESLFGALRGMLKPLIAEAPVQLIFEDTNLPSLHSDEGKIAQILRNFISNAIKFTPQGEVRVSARPLPSEGSAAVEFIEFCVSDTGIGISPDNLTKIWDEFSQVETPLHRRNKGTGLGLSLARKLAEILGGSVRVQSEAGVGSQFFLTIPCIYGGDTDGALISPSAPPTDAPTPSSIPHPEAPKALIIDDNDVDRYLLRQILGDALQVVEASGGVDGVRLAREIQPRVIFLDLDMPGLDGRQVLEMLRGDSQTRDIPVVVHTSHVLDETKRRELEALSLAVVGKERTADSIAHLQAVLSCLGLYQIS